MPIPIPKTPASQAKPASHTTPQIDRTLHYKIAKSIAETENHLLLPLSLGLVFVFPDPAITASVITLDPCLALTPDLNQISGISRLAPQKKGFPIAHTHTHITAQREREGKLL